MVFPLTYHACKRRLLKTSFWLFILSLSALPCIASPPPIITSQPASATVPLQGSASFFVTVSSGTTLTYQWFKNGTPIQSANSNSYTIQSVTGTAAGTYWVAITNAGGWVISSNAILSIVYAPVITTQPTNTGGLGGPGSSAIFSVVASASPAPAYNWYHNNAVMGPGSTSSNLTVTPIGPAQVGNYFVVVTNNYGSVTSAVVTLTQYVAPSIGGPANQPANATVSLGGTASFTVTPSGGTTPFSYRWYFNGSQTVDGANISGSTSSTLTLLHVQASQAGNYTVSVSNLGGTVTSAPAATLTVNIPATITNQPQSLAPQLGQAATFSVGAAGTGNLTYLWYFNGAAVTGPAGNKSTFTLSSAGTVNVGTYFVVVANTFGSVTSAVASLSVLLSRPVNQAVSAGGNASFSVSVSNAVPITYQWSFNSTNLEGATNVTLLLTNLQSAAGGIYAVAINSAGSVLTNCTALLTIGWMATVTSTSDSGPGSLRQALLDGNASSLYPRTVVFQIPGSAPFTIKPLTLFPAITNSMSIDATTQPGYSNQPVIQVDGGSLPKKATGDGLVITASGCTVKALDISGFPDNGITLSNGTGNVIQGNFIGCAPNGTTKNEANGRNGIMIYNSSANIIGGTNAFTRNVVVDSLTDGIHLEGARASSNQVLGNFIGLDSTGRIPEGIAGNGIVVSNAPSNIIGGTNSGAGNVISSQGGDGLYIGGSNACFNMVVGNLIGTDVTGTNNSQCNGNGITIFNAPSNTVGGVTLAAANVIAFNQQNGIAITGPAASNNLVLGNFIGTDRTGTLNLKNNSAGVYLAGTSNNVVGGKTSDAANTIAFNNQSGVIVSSGQCAIMGNSLYSNGGNADISLLNGANANAAPPVISGATNNTGVTWISGALTNAPGQTYRLEFFASPAASDAKTFLGSKNVTTSKTGGVVQFSISISTGNITNQYLTATATDTNGNTSPISVSQAVKFNGTPAITDDPEGLTRMAGLSASLSVEAVGSPRPAYQWYLNGSPLRWATNANLTFNPLATTNTGSYTVVVTNAYGAVTSIPAVVTVTNPVIILSTAGGGMGMTSTGFGFKLSIPVGSTYVIMASTNLIAWTPIVTNVATSGGTAFTDESATNYMHRFYRAIIP
ncbi:MAG TPA: immunoglobulin domain-containing protein [Verrucomicrobiae bacterium]|nr:immunoglobulin domain-containing protein [Verrucomicrobiae bacterium]